MIDDYIYYVETSNGKTYCDCDRQNAFDYYESNNGTKLWTKTKDLFPTIEVIIDKPNVDIRLIRKDNTVSKTPVNIKESIKKYDEKNTTQVKLKLNNKTDKDILDLLEQVGVGNKQTIIKEALRDYIKNNK